MNSDGDVVGSVSGDCVEGVVQERCRETLESGGVPVPARFGHFDSDAFAVGSPHGGEIEILVQRVDLRFSRISPQPLPRWRQAVPPPWPRLWTVRKNQRGGIVTGWPHRYLAATEVDARTAVCVLIHDVTSTFLC
ncbi:XdhC family protein [Streptomyces sp. NPDC088124]|uniref:XdhC family protein n=1 Tax=Streptomyces sp. NPDC088124 TaxID=3154654 RepID=UPI00342D7AB6